MNRQKKPGKDKLSTIRAFLAGEDIMHLIQSVKACMPTWFEKKQVENTDGFKPSWLVDGNEVEEQEYLQTLADRKAKGAATWEETKVYKDSDSITVPDDISLGGVGDTNRAAIETAREVSREQLHRLYLDAELKKLQTQGIIDLEIRDKMIWWSSQNAPQ